MKIFGFDFRFDTTKMQQKVNSVINFVKQRFSNIKSNVKQVDMTILEDLFKEGVADSINKSRVNYTPRMVDILQGWHLRETTSGITGKRTFEIYHDFLTGKDKRYSVTIRNKEYRTYGKRILLSLEKGRKDYWIVPKKKGTKLVWGYPTMRQGTSPHQRVAKAVYVPKTGLYDKGIGMLKAGKSKLSEYFRSRNISVTLKVAKMKGF